MYVQRIKQMLDNFESTGGYGEGYSDSVIDVKRDMRSINEYPFPIFPVLSIDRLFIRFHRVSVPARRSVLQCGERKTR